MVTPGQSFTHQHTPAHIAHATVQALRRTVPAAVPGELFEVLINYFILLFFLYNLSVLGVFTF